MSKWEKSTEETANCNFTRFKVQYQNQKRLQVLFYQYSIVHSVFPILSYCECGTCQVGASVCACTATSHPCSTTLHLIPLRQSLSLNLELNWYPASKVQQSSCLCPIKCQDYRHGHTQLLHGYWDLNSDSFTCTLSTLKQMS